MPGKPAGPLAYVIKSTIATAPPELQINFDKSKLCFAIYLIQVAANFRTN
jgi:hypothetical protein